MGATATLPNARCRAACSYGHPPGEDDAVAYAQRVGHLLVIVDAGKAHEQQVDIGTFRSNLLHGAQEMAGALVFGQQPQIDDDRGVRRQTKARPQLHHLRSGNVARGRNWLVLTQSGNGRIEPASQPKSWRRTRSAFDELVKIKPAEWSIQVSRRAQRWIDRALPTQEVVVDHFFGQAALKVEQDGQAKEATKHLADERTFMQVRVDDVETLTSHHLQRLHAQQGIEDDLVPARPDFVVLAPGNRQACAGCPSPANRGRCDR